MTAALYYTTTRVVRSLQLIEAVAKRVKTRTTLEAPINKLQVQLARIFAKQSRDLIRALEPLRVYFVEAGSSVDDDFAAVFDAATLDTSAEMAELVLKGVRSTLLLGGKTLLNEFGMSLSFSLDNPRAAQYLVGYGAQFITGVDEHTRQEIKNLLHNGIDEGLSYNQIAQAIKSKYKDFSSTRARLIAVTELGNAYSAGNFSAAGTLKQSGLVLEKRWLTLGDSRVSEGCKANAAVEWIPLDDAFPSGHQHPVRFPGCRCTAQYQRVKGTSIVPSVTTPTGDNANTPGDTTSFAPQQFATGAKADKYYTANSPIKSDDLDYFAQAAMQSYQHEGYKGINAGLRTNDKKLLKEWKNEITQLDGVFKGASTTEDIRAHRGLLVQPGTAAEALLNSWEVGSTYREPGYMSTTVDPKRIDKFFSSVSYGKNKQPSGTQKVYIEVRVPEGTKAVYMNGAVEQRGITNYKEEKELLVNRDQEYRVVSKETDANGNVNVVIELV